MIGRGFACQHLQKKKQQKLVSCPAPRQAIRYGCTIRHGGLALTWNIVGSLTPRPPPPPPPPKKNEGRLSELDYVFQELL